MTSKRIIYLFAAGLVMSSVGCAIGRPVQMTDSTVIKDTSFTIQSAFLKEVKKYPFIEIAKVELSPSINVRQNVKYKSDSGRQLYADIYYPKLKNKVYPSVLLIHGGGWKSGDKTQMDAMGKYLAEKGYVAVSAEYRLSPEAKYPAALNDLTDALAWMKENSKVLALDPLRIAVLGVSAGGQLAALLGTRPQTNHEVKIAAIVDIDGILAFHHPESEEGQVASEWLGGSYAEKPHEWEEASALTHAGAKTPPVLFVNSQNARFHAGQNDFLKKISPFGIYTETKTITATPHTFWLFNPWFKPTMGYVVAFLNKIFEPQRAGT